MEEKTQNKLRELLHEYVDFGDGLLYVENRSYDDLTDLGMEFLDDCGVDLERIKKRVDEGGELDLNNGEFGDRECGGDAIAEWADEQIDIYNADLRAKAQDYQDYIEDVIDDFGSDVIKNGGLITLFQYGQSRYYEELGYCVLNAVEAIIKDWDNIDEEYKK